MLPPTRRTPPLQAGDRLTGKEFLRHYRAQPDVNHAELIEGIVSMGSPVSAEGHGEPHVQLVTWLGVYVSQTRGVAAGDNSTIQLDADNYPQPDAYLRLSTERGGQSKLVDGFLVGAPELIVEIAASSVSRDLHDKFNVYRRNGVREYVVWRVWDAELDWFVLREGRYERLAADAQGVYRSEVFPGLWLDAPAVIANDARRVLETLQLGLASAEHQAFVG